MWMRTCGPVEDRLDFLGTEESCLYLLKGDRYLLLGGAGPWAVPDLERQLAADAVDLDRIAGIYLSHSHFDHCGAVPYLRRRLPRLPVLASGAAKTLLGMEKATRNMALFLAEALHQSGAPCEVGGLSLEFEPFPVTHVLSDGEELDLGGGVRLAFYETPGHSRCSLTAYEPRRGWLFPGDSLPVPSADGTTFVSTASESFVTFRDSLRRLEGLDVSLCAWEHHGVRTGDDVRGVVSEGIEFTARYKASVADLVARHGDPERAAEEVCRTWLDRARLPFLPERVMLHIARGIVANALKEEL